MDSKELSSQLKKPTGEAGREVSKALNDSNRGLYDLSFEMIDFKPNQQVLEIGFGNGIHFPEYFEVEPNVCVTGVDFSEDMCEEAKNHNPGLIDSGKLSIHCLETSSLHFPNSSFDLVIAINVIYFLDPAELHLKEIYRILKPGSLFLIGFRPRHVVEHLEFTKQNFILYEPDELKILVEDNGFEMVKEKTNTYQKLSVDETELEVKDSCMVAKNERLHSFIKTDRLAHHLL